MKYDTSSFTKKAKEIHGGKYDYSKVEYTDQKTKVCIICPKHGEFWIRPSHHINTGCNRRGCPICGDELRREKTRKKTDWFIEKAKEIHGGKYDYSKVEYIHTMSGVTIICPEHGEFIQTPNRHLSGHGCPKCGGNYPLTKESFIEKAKNIHGNKYDYSKVEYTGNCKSKVCIICPKHGEFWQYAHQHLQGRGCPLCRQSTLEKEVKLFLDLEGIEYVAQKRATWLGRQSLDFYIPKYNIAIECQGKQHFVPAEHFGGEERYIKTKKLDRIKNEICRAHGIEILYYSHYSYEYEYEVLTTIEELKRKIYEITNFHKNQHFV